MYGQPDADGRAAGRRTVEQHGREYAKDFLLMSENARGVSRTVAEGDELVDLALAEARPTKSLPAVLKQRTG